MKFVALLLILTLDSAWGNPTVAPGIDIYISFERLAVVVGPSAAEFRGTFKFKTKGHKSYATQTVAVRLPIWFPIDSKDDSRVAGFWAVFDQSHHSLSSSKETQMLKEVLDLKVEIAGRAVQPTLLLISGRQGKSTEFPESRQVLGCRSLLFYFPARPEEIGGENPVTISYRQPLLEYKGGRYFVYIPIFDNLPAGISTANMDMYSLSLTACPTCDLKVKASTFITPLRAGDEITLAPQHLQPIRGLVQTRANESLHSTPR